MNRHLFLTAALMACGTNPSKMDTAHTDGDEPSDPGSPDLGSTDVWGTVYSGSDPRVPFLPDGNARYWRYAFEQPPAGTALLIDGPLHGARYQSIDVYDDTTRTSLGALRDVELGESLTLWLAAPEELDALDAPGLPLPDGPAALFMRMYDPEQRVPDPTLPTVSLIDLATGTASAPPLRVEPAEIPQSLIDSVMAQREIAQRDDRVDFYRIDASGLYAADDNLYLVAQIVREPGQVITMSFQPPTWSDDAHTPAEVRYWSLTQCDRQSYCHHTIADREVVTQDGLVHVVIGDDVAELRAAAGDRTYLPWSTPSDEMVLIYRNLATTDGVAHALSTVPSYDDTASSEGQEATATLGERAPSGVRCDRDAFLEGSCGR